MRAADIARLIDLKGETVTVRRLTGSQRVPFDVVTKVVVETGAARTIAGDVEITGDRVIMLSDPLTQAGWRGPPRLGDRIIYANGHTAEVQAGTQSHLIEPGSYAYIVTTLGG